MNSDTSSERLKVLLNSLGEQKLKTLIKFELSWESHPDLCLNSQFPVVKMEFKEERS